MKKIYWLSLVIFLGLGSCIPATAVPSLLPDEITTYTPTLPFTPILSTNTVTATPNPVFATDTPPAPTQATGTATTTPSLSEAFLSEIHMMDESEGWAWASVETRGAFFLLRTSDGGLNWEDVSPDIQIGVPFFLDGKIAWAPVYDPSTYSNTSLLQTMDGGNTWKVVNETIGNIDVSPYFYDYAFQDTLKGWWRSGDVGAGTAHMRFYETVDGGATWEPVVINVTGELANNYYISTDTDDEVAVCNICGTVFYFDLSRILFAPGMGSPSKLFMTDNMGKTWWDVTLSGLPDNLYSDTAPIQYPTFFNDKEGILPVIIEDNRTDTAQLFIYETRDNGLTWAIENSSLIIDQYSKRGLGVQFFSRLDGFLASQGELSITHDGGKSWISISLPDEFKNTNTTYTEKDLNLINPRLAWIFLRKRSKDTNALLAYLLLKTTDGGIHWEEIVPVIKQ